MGDISIHGAPGLPGIALDTPNASELKSFKESLKRSYASFAGADVSLDFQTPASKGSLFKPDVHLAYQPPKKVYTMEDIGLPLSNGVSPVAVSEPFQLFSEEAINMMRAEVLSDAVLEGFSYTSDIAPRQLRGYAPQHAKFVAEAWKNPATLKIISDVAGIDLVPVIDYEIGHVNLSVPGKIMKNEAGEIVTEDNGRAIVDWHRDSYPFVCVLMMSNTDGMVGGETALRTGSGDIMKVRGPTKGCAVVLQGRYIEHQALRAFGSKERITMVTSFRPRSAMIRDDTVLNTVRPVSHLPALYGQVIEYQLENMEARIREYLKTVRESMKADKFDVKAFKKWVAFERRAIDHIDREIVEEERVTKGALADDIAAERANMA